MIFFELVISKSCRRRQSSVSEVFACTTTVKYGYGDGDEEHSLNLIVSEDWDIYVQATDLVFTSRRAVSESGCE